ncbi:MAG: GMP synthase-like glutamine amidotransferase [Gammaproteobacteria bacterium]|jgi:GMP synthase-like glutamine amidotransferase
MRVHCFQHAAFEGLGSIEPWLATAGHTLTKTKLYESPSFPDLDSFDLLIILGGPMGVGDTPIYPWLEREKAFIKEVIAARKLVLGICLGAQLIASVLGSKIYPNRYKEIGWFPINGTSNNPEGGFEFPQTLDVFHWHGDTFDLPQGAIRIATSRACPNQAFQLNRQVIGLQFHLETTVDTAREIVVHCGDELVPRLYIQSATAIEAVMPAQYELLNQAMTRVPLYFEELNSRATSEPVNESRTQGFEVECLF